MMIVGDNLYSKQPFIGVSKEQKMHFILGAKPKDHKGLMEDIEGLRRGGYLSRFEYTDKKKRYVYEWANDLPLNGYLGGEVVNNIEFQIYNALGKRTYRNSWVTELEVGGKCM